MVVSGPEESTRTTAVVWCVRAWLTQTTTATPSAASASAAAMIRVAEVGVPARGGACAVELGAAHDALLSVFAASSAALTCTSDQPGREGHFLATFFRRHLRNTFVADGWRIDGRDDGGSVACPAGMG